jgi:hypothetical protein
VVISSDGYDKSMAAPLVAPCIKGATRGVVCGKNKYSAPALLFFFSRNYIKAVP